MAKKTLDDLIYYPYPHMLGADLEMVLVYTPIKPGGYMENQKYTWRHIDKRTVDQFHRDIVNFLQKNKIDPAAEVVTAAEDFFFHAHTDPKKRKSRLRDLLKANIEFLEKAIDSLEPIVESPNFCKNYELPWKTFVDLKSKFEHDLKDTRKMSGSRALRAETIKFLGPTLKILSPLLSSQGLTVYRQERLLSQMIKSVTIPGLDETVKLPDHEKIKKAIAKYAR